MAQPTNTFDSYDSIGTKEDLSDVIYRFAPPAPSGNPRTEYRSELQ